jgi:hypothetical protein
MALPELRGGAICESAQVRVFGADSLSAFVL